ncbi:MAG: alcohol dehydrogenase [Calditrichaeota bacterium]|nr:MAG: alcohol dehydrogenase [Calditrichota bacterium]
MRAIVFHGKQTLKHEHVPDPRIEAPTDVIVKVHLCGICGSDLHPYHEREKGLDAGTVMGHEFVGEIAETGRDVRSLKPGEVVASPFTTNCGRCFFCRTGLTSRCEKGQLFGWRQGGVGLHGGQAEYVRVPLAETTLLPVPKGVSSEDALLLGDVFATGYFCAEMAEVKPDGIYAVLGCGPVGLMAVVAARELGAEHLYAVDAVPSRLRLAEHFGAMTLNFEQGDVVAALRDATSGRGVDAVLEAVGSPEAGQTAFELVRPGGVIATVGVHTEARMAFTPTQAYDKNLTYRTGRCPARSYMNRLLPLLQMGKYDLAAIISHRLPLAQGVEAYRIFDQKSKDCIKVVLNPDA